MRRFDDFLLRRGDAVLEWLWAWTGVRRRQVFAGLFLLYAVGRLYVLTLDGEWPSWLRVLVLMLLGLLVWRAWVREGRDAPDVLNGRTVLVRETTGALIFRCFLYAYLFLLVIPFGAALIVAVGPTAENVVTVISDLAYVLCFYCQELLVPMGPRKRIKLPKLATPKLDLSPAPAYGGAWGRAQTQP